MLRFFSTIRQRLLAEGRLSKYLAYALGEIILVVAGILIALAVNNWNEERKEIVAGQDLLLRIQRDLRQDINQFQSAIAQNHELRTELKSLLERLYNDVETLEQAKQIAIIYDKALDQVFAPNDNTYQSIVSSGTLGLIKNPDLKDAIIDLYSEYEQTAELLGAINRWMEGVAIALDVETDFLKFNNYIADIYTTDEMLNDSDLAFLNDKNDPRFKLLVRAVSATAFNQQVRSSYYETLIPECQQLISQIETELDRAH